MKEQLEGCLASYLDDVSRYLAKQRPNPKLVPTPAAIRFWFEECEELPSWRVLTDAAERHVQKNHLRRLDPESWYGAKLGNWFRRRGYYSSLAHGETIDREDLYASLIADASAENWRLTTLAIIDDWGFGTERLSYTDFEIIRFEKDELLRILSADLNRIFFPGSVSNVDRFYKRWFIKVEESQKTDRFHNAPIRFATREFRKMIPVPHEWQYSTFSFTNRPEPIETALSVLALWPWGNYPSELAYSVSAKPQNTAKKKKSTPNEFTVDTAYSLKIPFVIQISDDPFLSPPASPPVDRLKPPLTPDMLELSGDELSGDEFEEDSFGGNVETFDEFIELQQQRLLAIREKREWEFIDRAIRLLAKAVLSIDEFERLIWCTVAVEALLNKRDPELTIALTRRVSVLFAPAKTSRQRLARGAFDRAYDLRSRLLHGSPIEEEDRVILSNALMLARRVALRMIHVASELSKALLSGELNELPSRDELLRALDAIYEARRKSEYARLSLLELRVAQTLQASSEGE